MVGAPLGMCKLLLLLLLLSIYFQLVNLLSATPLSEKPFFRLLKFQLWNTISDDWLNLNKQIFSSFKNTKGHFQLFCILRGATAAASDIGVMSGMHDIGTYRVK